MPAPPRIRPAGDRALVVEYGVAIDPATNRSVRALGCLLDGLAHPGLVETVPTYRSLMVHYDPRRVSLSELRRSIAEAHDRLDSVRLPPAKVVDIPTVYGGAYGPDLADVAAYHGLTPDEVVTIHAGSEYLVYMMGFTPGFPYLGSVSPRISTPRLGTPRTLVPAGSVGIAAQQTGIYPTASPGGWRLLGRTPVRLFDLSRTPPVLFEAGDYVRFVPVDADHYGAIQHAVEAGTFVPVVHPRE